MSAIHLETSRGCPANARRRDALDALNDAGHWVVATLRAWRRRQRERAELVGLDARMLADIGLSRSEAEFLANKPFWRE